MLFQELTEQEWLNGATFVDSSCQLVVPIRFNNKMIDFNQKIYFEKIAYYVEKRLAGRLLLFPPLYFGGQALEIQAFVDNYKRFLLDFTYCFLMLPETFKNIAYNGSHAFFIPLEGNAQEIGEAFYQYILSKWSTV